MQTIDYEHIPFRCRKCHEHRHLFRECPLNAAHKEGNLEADKDKDGFVQASGKRRQGGIKQVTHVSKDLSTNNKYEVLQDQPKNPSVSQAAPMEKTPQQTSKGKEGETLELNPNTSPIDPTTTMVDQPEAKDGDVEMDLNEQELAGVDLEHLEHAYRHQKLYTIPPDQLRKVHKVFLNSSARSSKGSRIQWNQPKNQSKPQKDEKKRGRKLENKLIQEIGHFMVNSS